MISELKALFDYYEKEKGIDRNKMVEALSQALLAASKKASALHANSASTLILTRGPSRRSPN